MTVRVRLIGRPCVEAYAGATLPQPRGHKSWAVFARVALSERPQRRAVLADELFSGSDDPRTLSRAKAIAQHVDNPALHAKIRALTGSFKHPGKADLR